MFFHKESNVSETMVVTSIELTPTKFPDDLAVPGFAGGFFPVERERQACASFTDDGFSIEHVIRSPESGQRFTL